MTYEVVPISNHHARWVTKCYRDAPEPKLATENVNQDVDDEEDAVSDDSSVVPWAPEPHPTGKTLVQLREGPAIPAMEDPLQKFTGTRVKVTPAAIRMGGQFGVHIVKVKNVKNVTWAVILPPGIPVMKWCGFLCWNANTTEKQHKFCPVCTLNAKERDAPKAAKGNIETIDNPPVLKAFGCSIPWANWCNKIIELENGRRIDNKPYNFPAEFHINNEQAKKQCLADKRRKERIRRMDETLKKRAIDREVAEKLREVLDAEVANRVSVAFEARMRTAADNHAREIEMAREAAAASTRRDILTILNTGVSLADARAHPERVTPGLTPFKRKAECFYPEKWNEMSEREKDAWIEETERNYNPRSLEMD